jgi:hypothetical protein
MMNATVSVELANRLEITDFLSRYAIAVDTRDWAALECCFTPKATGDYGERRGVATDRAAMVAICRGALTGPDFSHHLAGTVVIDLDGHHARSTARVQAQHYFRDTPGGDLSTVWGIYHDRLERPEDGWRIVERTLETRWTSGNLGVFAAAEARAASGR